VGTFGAEDRFPGVRGIPERLEHLLTAAGIDHDVKIYPAVGHGFLDVHDPADLSLPLRIIAGAVGAGSSDQSGREDARRRIVAFFRRHLDDASAGNG
jgi:carboxymethylenebutenolidase